MKKKNGIQTKKTLLFLVAALFALSAVPGCSTGEAGFSPKKSVLFHGPKMILADSLVFSPDLKKAAYIVVRREKLAVYVNEDKIGLYDKIGNREGLKYGPGGKHLAFEAHIDGKEYVVLDGELSKPFDSAVDPVFGRDGDDIAYAAIKNSKLEVFKNGKSLGAFYSVSPENIKFMGDGALMYIATRNDDAHLLMKDKTVVGEYDSVGSLTISPDGERYACAGKKNGMSYFIVDGKQGPAFEQIPVGTFHFSADSRSFVYIGFMPDKTALVHNHKIVAFLGDRQQNHLVDRFRISPDGRHVTHIDTVGDKCCIYKDGLCENCFDFIAGKTVTFLGDSNALAFAARKGDEHFVSINGAKYLNFEGIGDAGILKADGGKDILYAGTRGGKAQIVRNDKIVYTCDAIRDGSLVFSPDGGNWACYAENDGGWRLVINGKDAGLSLGGVYGLKFAKNDELIVVGIEAKGDEAYQVVRYAMEL